MAVLRVDNVGAAGFQPDIENWQLPINSWTDLRDVSVSENSIRPNYLVQLLLEQAGVALEETYLSVFLHDLPTVTYLVLCTAKRVFVTRGQRLIDITPDGFEFSANTRKRWKADSFNGFLILNNTLDEPYYWPLIQLESTLPKLQPLSSYPGESPWPVAQTCEFIVGFNNSLFAGNITRNGDTFPYLVQFSDFAEPGTLPQKWTPAPDNSAGSRDLAEGLDEIVTALPFRDTLLVRKEQTVVAFRFRGGQFVYDRKTVAEETACLNRHAVVNTKDFQLAVGLTDIYVTQGGQHRSVVKNKTKNWFFDQLNRPEFEKVFCLYFQEESEVWIFAPQGDSTFCNIALIWNYIEDTFTTRTCENYLDAVEGAGILPDGYVSWADLAATTWAEWDATWGLPRDILLQRRLIFVKAIPGLTTDYTRQVLIGGGLVPVPEVDEVYLERLHIPFPRGEVMDWESIKQVSHITPKIRRETPNFYIDIWLGTQADIDSPVRWYGPKRWTPGKKKVSFDKSGRFISLKARMPAGEDFRLTGYDIEYKLTSRR